MPVSVLLPAPDRRALRRGLRDALPGGAVIVLDIDGFAEINARLGERVGDQLLVRFLQHVRAAAPVRAVVQRIGDDEVAVVIREHTSTDELDALCRRLLTGLVAPAPSLGGHTVEVAVSAGAVVVAAAAAQTVDALLATAQNALAAAKAAGGDRHVLHGSSPAIKTTLGERELQTAWNAGELHVDYQPIVALQSSRVQSIEALARWTRPDGSRVSPLEFIGVAERCGLIVELGAWILREACVALATWQRERPATAPSTLNVNLSPAQLADPDLLSRVARTLADTRLPTSALTLEVTESLPVEDDGSIDALRRLRRLGVGVALDDFGTGYSSLGRLRRLPLTELKLDRQFVFDLDRDGGDVARSILSLSHTLGLPLVAEGIETAGQKQALRAMGFPLGQGFLLGRPAPAAVLADPARLDARRLADAA